jgi:hypothetical protein
MKEKPEYDGEELGRWVESCCVLVWVRTELRCLMGLLSSMRRCYGVEMFDGWCCVESLGLASEGRA